VSFAVEEGEFVAIFGDAKSTLCLLISGAIPHLIRGKIEGNIYVAGVNTQRSRIAELATIVGMVLQDPENQLFNLTVEADVAFGLENLCIPREEMEERIRDALEKVRMTEFRSRISSELSGGQKQRVAIAAILARRPGIFVLDEPTRELDPMGNMEVFEVLTRLKREGRTIVIVDNNPEFLAPLATKILYVRQASVRVFESPRAFFENIRESPFRIPQVVDVYFRVREKIPSLAGSVIPLTVEEGVDVFGNKKYHRS
jgi:energy-coupling factor transport system ATP-binding protein